MDTLYIVKDDGETEMIGEITECDINSDEMKEQGYQQKVSRGNGE